MFTAEIIKARLNEKPFRPLRIIASEGLSYDIFHPDLVWVGSRDLQIGFASPSRPTIYDRTVRIAMVHVVGLEDIPTPEPTNKNGQHS
jgi:hypothetical protein